MKHTTFTHHRIFALLVVLLLGVTPYNQAYATPKPETTAHNFAELSEQPNNFFDHFYTAKKTDAEKPIHVYIAAVEISFDERWNKNFKSKIKPGYKKYVSETYAQLMQEQLAQAIEKSNNFSIVETQDAADLILGASIKNLYINGPEYFNATDTYVNFAGRAEFHMTATTSNSKLLAYFIDSRETRNWAPNNSMQVATRARNYRDFKFLMSSWAENAVLLLP